MTKVTSFDGGSPLNDHVTSVGESRALEGHMFSVSINIAYDVCPLPSKGSSDYAKEKGVR